ncbi:MAG: hypothetical protein H7Y11_11170 [Armatimonadetes bacterium]|nr:hypothetical protein [Anaerolineae bacterium]
MSTRKRTRDNGFSVFRIGVISAIIGGAFLVGAFVFTTLDQQGARSPLVIDSPAGAELRDQEETSGSRRQWYVVGATDAEQVATYYNQELQEFYGADTTAAELCKRIPASGNYDDYIEGTGMVPYMFKCVFDSSTFQSERFTEVQIEPGVRNNETGDNLEGSVVVIYTQVWQP